MRNRTPWILLSQAADDCTEQRATTPILRKLRALRIRCEHIDYERGLNGVSPVLLTEEGRVAIAAFLRTLRGMAHTAQPRSQ